jgi:hypothetical protein
MKLISIDSINMLNIPGKVAMTRLRPLPADLEEQLRARGELRDGEHGALLVGTPAAILDTLAEQLTPEPRVVSPAVVLQARRNAEARAQVDAEFGLLSSEQVAELVGSRSANRASAAYGLRSTGRIFSVTSGGVQRYPGFQFDPTAGQPRRGVTRTLQVLADAALSGWELALWFTSPTGLLDGHRPVDLLDTDPDAVVAAAHAELAAAAAV